MIHYNIPCPYCKLHMSVEETVTEIIYRCEDCIVLIDYEKEKEDNNNDYLCG